MSGSLPLCHFATLPKQIFESIKVSKFHDKNSKRATQRHGENSKEMRRSC